MAKVDTDIREQIEQYQLNKAQQLELTDLLKLCHDRLDETDDELVILAFKLCCRSHEGVKRASGEPYYLHPVEVAKIMADDFNIDDESVVAALLHDTVEDTAVTLEMVEEMFNPIVRHLIDGVTKISGVFESRDTKQAETFMKLILSMAEDIRVVLIKFADRLHNMRTISHLQRQKQLKKATESMELYAPLAHRFGLFKIKNEFEDLCFKVIEPISFKFIVRKLR
jgi:GTP pyrophosphokinase/guanosine-3',5'-bis(diphosphate) 3'-pyrophosphohydrolase